MNDILFPFYIDIYKKIYTHFQPYLPDFWKQNQNFLEFFSLVVLMEKPFVTQNLYMLE